MTKEELKDKLIGCGLCIDNDYLVKYIDLIHSNLTLGYIRFQTDLHHIIPRHYFRTNNIPIDESDSNKVYLLAKDHILAHYYLFFCSATEKYRVANALSVQFSLNKNARCKLEPYEKNELRKLLDNYQELIEAIRVDRSNKSKRFVGENNPFYGKHHGESYTEKLRVKRASWSDEKRVEVSRKLSESHKGQKRSQEAIESARQKMLGRKHSPETIEKMKQAKKLRHKSGTKGKRWMNNGVIEKPVYPEDVQTYLGNGYIPGRLKSTTEKANTTKKLNPTEPGNKGKIMIHNTFNKTIYVDENNLESYLSQGWFIGRGKRNYE